MGSKIAPHESFELHELLTFKNLCVTKAALMAGAVEDEGLRSLMQDDINRSREQISELKMLLENHAYSPDNTPAGL